MYDKKMGPCVYKESSSGEALLQRLNQSLAGAQGYQKDQIKQKIKMTQYGLSGEEKILFELKNSHIPMIILHDICLEKDGLRAQIDFIVITDKITFVLECKNLIGDIEVDREGSFIRTLMKNGAPVREGIYSPITQNKRHLEIIRKIFRDRQPNPLLKALTDWCVRRTYQGAIVLANPKTLLDASQAPKEIAEQIIRGDQLIEWIRRQCAKCKDFPLNAAEMEQAAQRLLSLQASPGEKAPEQSPNGQPAGPEPAQPAEERPAEPQQPHKNDDRLYQALKEWRYQTAKLEKTKPYYIFYNTTLDELVEKQPSTIEELLTVKGLGQVKCGKYGGEILRIISENGRR